MYGYHGKLLRVNLTTRTSEVEEVKPEVYRQFLGGRALGSKILYEEVPAKVDPLGSMNKIIFMTGPLTGLKIPGNGRYTVMAKSPLTGLWGEASCGGYFGPAIRFAGYEGIIIEGQSEEPVYLWINEGQVEIRDARHLWGKDVSETTNLILQETGSPGVRVACIGPAGENLVKYASIMGDKRRAAGRTGIGAVMGSKKLKAIAVRGSKTIPIYNEGLFQELTANIRQAMKASPAVAAKREYGQAAAVMFLNEQGILPTKNFFTGVFSGAANISAEAMNNSILKKRWACPGCPIACGRVVAIETGPYAPVLEDGPEYETLGAFGSLCLNDNLEAIAFINQLCNRYGIDTISAGVTIAFAMECYEKGLITLADTGGIDLSWGRVDSIIKLLHQIAARQGFGNLLADGVQRAAKVIGRGAEDFAMHVKGLEFALHEPRGKQGQALSYATSNRGACHLQAPHDQSFAAPNVLPEIGLGDIVDPFSLKGKAGFVKKGQDYWALLDSLVLCKFVMKPIGVISFTELNSLINAVTGWELTNEQIMAFGERAFTLGRMFNVREGVTAVDDCLPKRSFETLPGGAHAGTRIDVAEFKHELAEYYRLRGWSVDTGIPGREILERLGLGDVVKS
jgi:aldehyde:ferredoxin oxidoreductase